MKQLLLLRESSTTDLQFFEKKGFKSQFLLLSELLLRPLTPAVLTELSASEWLFFTSKTPVGLILSAQMEEKKIACIGQKTAEELRKHGLEPDFIASHATKEAFIAEWSSRFGEGAKIFYPMSDLAEPLSIKGCQISNVICYENRVILPALTELSVILSTQKIDAVYLTSPSAWHRFCEVYAKFNFPLELIAIGKTTQAAIVKDGFRAILKEELEDSAF